MTMYSILSTNVGPHGGRAPAQFKQDFWLGANSSISSGPGTGTSLFVPDYQLSGAKQDQADVRTFIDNCDKLYDLEDTVLPDQTEFGPDDLFPELFETKLLDQLQPQKGHTKTPLQKKTIKLKRVKMPKKAKVNNENGTNFQVVSIPCGQQSHENYFNRSTFEVSNSESMDYGQFMPVQDTEQHIDFFGADVNLSPLYDLADEMTESRLEGPVLSGDFNIIDALTFGASDMTDNRIEEPILSGDISLLDAVVLDESDAILDSILSDNDDILENSRLQENQMGFKECDEFVIQSDDLILPDIIELSSPSFHSDNWSEVSTSGGSSPEFASVELLEDSTNDLSMESDSVSMMDGYIASAESSPVQAYEYETIDTQQFYQCSTIAIVPPKQIGKKKKSLTPEMKYLRKKQQNKEAAIRYRQKKRKEEQELSESLAFEGEQNVELKKEYKDLKQEIDIVKKLIRETMFLE